MKTSDDFPEGVLGLSDYCVRVCNATLRFLRLSNWATLRNLRPAWFPRTLDVALGILSLWFVVGFVSVVVDPCRLGSASDLYSEQVIDRVMSPFYASQGQQEIAVVLIDEDTLAAEGIGWPPPYDYYSQTIYRIMRQGPKAIFVDILLECERPTDRDSLIYAREDLSDYADEFAIPVFFAQSAPGVANLFGDVPMVRLAPSGWVDMDYPLVVSPEGSEGRKGEHSPSYPTAATMLYRIARPDAPLNLQSPPSLVVQWGSAAPAVTRDKDLLPGSVYDFVAPSYFERFCRSGWILLQNLFAGLEDSSDEQVRRKVPYTLTVQAHQLAEFKDILKDKIVLLGVHVNGIQDVVENPVYGQLPGVYKHAMALDNLIKYGDSYYTRAKSELFVYSAVAVLMSFLLTLLLRMHATKRMVRRVIYGSMFAVCAVLYFVLHIAPQNWVGLVIICALANAVQVHSHPESKRGESK